MRSFSSVSAVSRVLLVGASLLCVSACSTTTPVSTESPAQLTFTNISPYHVDAQRVEVETQYVPGSDPKDVSSSFAVPLDIVVKRYAENRLQAGGVRGGLKFIIEDARIYQTQFEQKNKVVNWMGAGKEDQYEVFLRLRLYYTDDMGMQEGRNGVLNFNRTLTVPASVSLAERERRQLQFLDQLMKDVDANVTKALQERFSMTDSDAIPLTALLSTPQVR